MTTRYQPLIDPVVQAFQGQMEALKKLPVFVYMNTVADRLYQQLNEFYKYVELETELRQVLRSALQHTDKLVTQVVKDLKVTLTFDYFTCRFCKYFCVNRRDRSLSR